MGVICPHIYCYDIIYSLQQGDFIMSKARDRMISQRPDGIWENKRNDASKASSIHKTQRDAINAARDMLKNQGGGELTVKGVDGRIRCNDTIPPGNDPNPPKDNEH